MFLEEFSLDAVGVFQPPPFTVRDTPLLPAPGTLLGTGASLFLGSDLFPARSLRKRRRLDRWPLTVVSESHSARYSGEILDQFDMDVFLGCVLKALRRETPVRRPMREFLKQLGRRPTPLYTRRLEASLFRLSSARIELDDRRYGCCVQLLDSVLVDRELGVFRAQASPEAVAALRGVGSLDRLARLRFGYGRRPLLKWLAGLILVLGGKPALLDLDRLRALCGNGDCDPRIFSARAVPALRSLVDMGYIHSMRPCRDGRILVMFNARGKKAAECRMEW